MVIKYDTVKRKYFNELTRIIQSNPAIVNMTYNESPDIMNKMFGPVPCNTHITLLLWI